MRIALSFLTRLPVGRVESADYLGALGRQAPLFPVVGLIVGAVSVAADWAAGQWFGPSVRSAVALIAGVWVTGALHLDGLMDTADGIGSHRSRERMLEIMRDSRVGAMGVVAGTLSLLLRFALLTELRPDVRWWALLAAPVLGRMAMAVAAGIYPAAGTGVGAAGSYAAAGKHPAAGSGLGAGFAAHVGRWQVAGAVTVGLVLAVAVGGPALGAPAWAGALLATLLAGRWLAAKLGGLTGDTYGALNELAEVAALAAFAAGGYRPW